MISLYLIGLLSTVWASQFNLLDQDNDFTDETEIRDQPDVLEYLQLHIDSQFIQNSGLPAGESGLAQVPPQFPQPLERPHSSMRGRNLPRLRNNVSDDEVSFLSAHSNGVDDEAAFVSAGGKIDATHDEPAIKFVRFAGDIDDSALDEVDLKFDPHTTLRRTHLDQPIRVQHIVTHLGADNESINLVPETLETQDEQRSPRSALGPFVELTEHVDVIMSAFETTGDAVFSSWTLGSVGLTLPPLSLGGSESETVPESTLDTFASSTDHTLSTAFSEVMTLGTLGYTQFPTSDVATSDFSSSTDLDLVSSVVSLSLLPTRQPLKTTRLSS